MPATRPPASTDPPLARLTMTLANFVPFTVRRYRRHILDSSARVGYCASQAFTGEAIQFPRGMDHMDLDFETVRTRGRANVPMTVNVERILGEEDLRALSIEKGSTAPPIKRITDRHHALARLIVEGKAMSEAAYICGISLSRASILKNDPQFMELLEFYRRESHEHYKDMHERLSNLSMDAVQLIADKMEDDPDSLSTNQLLEIAKMGADRTGFGPQSSQTNVNVNVGVADRLEEARKRIKARRIAMIEGTVNPEDN